MEEVEIPDIRNMGIFHEVVNGQTPMRPKERQLYIQKLLLCNPRDIKNMLFDAGLSRANKTFRSIIEDTSAGQQCAKTIGESCVFKGQEEITYNFDIEHKHTHCWLCGFPFLCDGNKAECEHLIPVTFAGLFTGIQSQRNKDQFTDAFMRAYETNYLYAHASCNRTKSNLMLLTWDDDQSKMVFDDEKGNILRERILKVRTVPQIKSYKEDSEYRERMIQNYKDKMQVICDFINAEYRYFLKQGLSMTDYIKYVVGMTKLYFSKTALEQLKAEGDRRDSLSATLGDITRNIKEESNEIIDAIEDNIKHTTTAKKAFKQSSMQKSFKKTKRDLSFAFEEATKRVRINGGKRIRRKISKTRRRKK